MSIIIDDMYNELIPILGLIEQLNLRQTNKYHNKKIQSILLTEYFKIKKQFPYTSIKKIPFYDICKNNCINLIKWLYSTNYYDKSKLKYHLEISCENGRMRITKFLHKIYNSEIQDNRVSVSNDLLFVISCKNNNLKLTKWIYKLGVNIHTDNNDAFIGSCTRNSMNTSKWLYSLGEIDKNIINMAFFSCCRYGKLRMAKWLYKLGADINYSVNGPFRISCQYGRLKIAKWLYTLGVDINEPDNAAFKFSTQEIKKWLKTL